MEFFGQRENRTLYVMFRQHKTFVTARVRHPQFVCKDDLKTCPPCDLQLDIAPRMELERSCVCPEFADMFIYLGAPIL